MKRKQGRYTETITNPTRLYLEDIEEIYSIIYEEQGEVSITTDEVELEGLEEISELHLDSLAYLQFFGYVDSWPNLSLTVKSDSVLVDILKSDSTSLGTLAEIKRVLARHEPPLWSSLDFNRFVSTSLIGLATFFLVFSIQNAITSLIIPASLVAPAAALWWYWVAFRMPRNKIILKYYKDSPSFWERNSDKILLSIISSFIH